MDFIRLIPEIFWQFFSDANMEIVIEIVEAFWVISLEVFGADFGSCHWFAGKELVFFKKIESTFEVFWRQNGKWQEVTVGFVVRKEFDGKDGHGRDYLFLFVVDGFGLENSALSSGRWRNKDDAAVFDDLFR